MSIIQPKLSLVQENEETTQKHWWQKDNANDTCAVALKPGDACPNCIVGTLDYDGLFLLTCNQCGKVAEGGVFT